MSQVRFSTGALVPPTPPSGQLTLYAKADKLLYTKNDAGSESGPINSGGGGGPVGPDNVVYLAQPPRGNDGTGTRGDASKPFATFSAALAACQNGDVLQMGPGIFLESTTPVWPPTVKRLAIIGSGRGGIPSFFVPGESITRVEQTTLNEHVISPPPDVILLILQNFTAKGGGGSGMALNVDGGGGGGACMSSGLYVTDMAFSSPLDAVNIRMANMAIIQNVFNWNGTWSFDTSSIVHCDNIVGINKLYYNWDNTLPDVPVFGRDTALFQGLEMGTLYLAGQSDVKFDASCKVGDITTHGSGFSVAGGLAPKIQFHGYISGNVDFTGASALPDTTEELLLDFTGAKMDGSLSFEVAGYTGNRQSVHLKNITHSGPGFDGTITAGDGVDIYLRTDALKLATGWIPLTTVASGTITPSRWLMAFPTAGGGLDLVPFGFTAIEPPVNIQATATGLPTSVYVSWAPPPSPAACQIGTFPPLPPGTPIYLEFRWT